MTLETVNTVFAALTFIVIAASAYGALTQLRHLRASNQLSALITVLEDWQKPEFQRLIAFVRVTLPGKLRDPGYLASIQQVPVVEREPHPWLHVCDYYEQIGSYLKYGLIDKQSWLDVSSQQVAWLYATILPCIRRLRELAGNESIFENFEYAAVISEQWNRRYPNGTYPANLPRFEELVEPAAPAPHTGASASAASGRYG